MGYRLGKPRGPAGAGAVEAGRIYLPVVTHRRPQKVPPDPRPVGPSGAFRTYGPGRPGGHLVPAGGRFVTSWDTVEDAKTGFGRPVRGGRPLVPVHKSAGRTPSEPPSVTPAGYTPRALSSTRPGRRPSQAVAAAPSRRRRRSRSRSNSPTFTYTASPYNAVTWAAPASPATARSPRGADTEDRLYLCLP